MNLENYIQSILAGVKTWVNSTFAKKRDVAQADWNVDDKNHPAFIKNKPFYDESSRVTLVNNLTSEDYSNGNITRCTFVPGQSYTVVWNGTVYDNLVCFRADSYNVIATTEKGHPFYIDDDGGNGLYIQNDTGNEYVVSIYSTVTNVKKIDAKYLPEMGKSDLIVNLEYVYNNRYTADKDIEEIWAAEAEGRHVILVTSSDGIKTTYERIGSAHGNMYVCVGSYGEYTTSSGIRYDYETGNWVLVDTPLHHRSDWSVSNSEDPAFIYNKPHITERDIVLKDGVNGYNYLIKMENGNLVSQCAIEYIDIVEDPANTRFVEGEAINFPDMVVMATCYDGSKRQVEYTCDPAVATLNMPYIAISHTEGGIVHGGITLFIDIVPIEDALIDFDYDDNGNGTYTITGWKETLNGEPSTEMIVPNSNKIII